MNVVTLIGNLATEVEVRETGPDKQVASFLLAVDRASREGGVDFVRVSAWDRQAELCEARSRWSHVGSSSSAEARAATATSGTTREAR